MSNGDEALLGQLPQSTDVCPHVQLTAHQDHLGVGTKLLRLPLPLWINEQTDRQTDLSDYPLVVRLNTVVSTARVILLISEMSYSGKTFTLPDREYVDL